MSSEYDDRDDEMAIYVKEHQRGDSTSSGYRQHLQPVPRPETKVFYSSAVKIGRLIENLSHDMEAGSFNFRANTQPLYSSTSSMSVSDTDGTWTVEERLDHMLGKMGA
ncbi:hypothetical protein BDZ89DRAFT_1126228 [Hymenopellis radicata]|nr:hypothetical protein BDZ89DRAFT_1126228 [Hymenopellis radicata]